ncbi:MAG: DUF899 domain-containing protein [Proteobacteria bacterium]|nr:DUF899 domain-containing protein [Pseudomonadota bacterium]
MPAVTSEAAWRLARDDLLRKEKAATHALDELAAQRRRLPMVAVRGDYVFGGRSGSTTLLDLFDGRRQLIVYHFMYAPGARKPCRGCSRRMDDMGRLEHLHARQTTLVAVARADYARLAAAWASKGWTVPVYSSGASTFNQDMGVTDADGDEDFGFSVFFRDDAGQAYRSYFTSGRGVEPAGFRALLDLTPYGRQETWEDSPPGWPQSPTHGWSSARDE